MQTLMLCFRTLVKQYPGLFYQTYSKKKHGKHLMSLIHSQDSISHNQKSAYNLYMDGCKRKVMHCWVVVPCTLYSTCQGGHYVGDKLT